MEGLEEPPLVSGAIHVLTSPSTAPQGTAVPQPLRAGGTEDWSLFRNTLQTALHAPQSWASSLDGQLWGPPD